MDTLDATAATAAIFAGSLAKNMMDGDIKEFQKLLLSIGILAGEKLFAFMLNVFCTTVSAHCFLLKQHLQNLVLHNFIMFYFRKLKEDVRIELPAGWRNGVGEMLHER